MVSECSHTIPEKVYHYPGVMVNFHVLFKFGKEAHHKKSIQKKYTITLVNNISFIFKFVTVPCTIVILGKCIGCSSAKHVWDFSEGLTGSNNMRHLNGDGLHLRFFVSTLSGLMLVNTFPES